MSDRDAVALTRSLLGFDTVNPPGRERDCARHLGALLEGWGFGIAYHEFADGRTSVIGRAGGAGSKAPPRLTRHIYNIAVGVVPWARDPLARGTDGGHIYRRCTPWTEARNAAI